jgi:RND superfamily putative drug exporter
MLKAFFAFPTQRVGRFVVLGAWLLALGLTLGLNLPHKFSAAQKNDARYYVPASAESTKANVAVGKIIDANTLPFIVVVHRPSKITHADRKAITAQLKRFNATSRAQPLTVGTGKAQHTVTLRDTVRVQKGKWLAAGHPSKDGTSELIVGAVKVTGKNDRLTNAVDALRTGVEPLKTRGLTVDVTGAAGFSYDGLKVFENLDGSLVIAAGLLVVVLLILIYRSPILFLIPIAAVAAAELVSRGAGYLLTLAGVTATGQSSAILSILVLGAGTDYALLVVARYREELRHHKRPRDAMQLAMNSAGPAVFASGMTVIAGLLTLMLATVRGTSGLGPVGALGVLIAMTSMLTLLPALFSVCSLVGNAGRWVFWPRIPHYAATAGDAAHGAWRRVGDRIARTPRRIWIGTAVLLLVFAGGLVTFSSNLSQSKTFIGKVESVEGNDLLQKSYPSGTGSPTYIVVTAPTKAKATLRAVRKDPAIASARLEGYSPANGVLIAATLKDDPQSVTAYHEIPRIRQVAQAASGDTASVGGDTAVSADLRVANLHDIKVIIPVVLAVVLLILFALLRAVLLPVLMILTVILSFAAALGLSSLVFKYVYGFSGEDVAVVLYTFVFLVALGIDYNIFLATRIREEAVKHGTREGILTGLAVTGGVITAAGVVLAGTFIVLVTTPVVFLVEVGLAIAIGVLLDTFLVRSILVPALALDIGHKIWWPNEAAIPYESAPREEARAEVPEALPEQPRPLL